MSMPIAEMKKRKQKKSLSTDTQKKHQGQKITKVILNDISERDYIAEFVLIVNTVSNSRLDMI